MSTLPTSVLSSISVPPDVVPTTNLYPVASVEASQDRSVYTSTFESPFKGEFSIVQTGSDGHAASTSASELQPEALS